MFNIDLKLVAIRLGEQKIISFIAQREFQLITSLLFALITLSKSETVKSYYFRYKIAPLISFSGAILLGKQ